MARVYGVRWLSLWLGGLNTIGKTLRSSICWIWKERHARRRHSPRLVLMSTVEACCARDLMDELQAIGWLAKQIWDDAWMNGLTVGILDDTAMVLLALSLTYFTFCYKPTSCGVLEGRASKLWTLFRDSIPRSVALFTSVFGPIGSLEQAKN